MCASLLCWRANSSSRSVRVFLNKNVCVQSGAVAKTTTTAAACTPSKWDTQVRYWDNGVYEEQPVSIRMLKMSAFVKRQATSLILYVFSRNVCARRAHENSPFFALSRMPSSAPRERWSPLARKAPRSLQRQRWNARWLTRIQQSVEKSLADIWQVGFKKSSRTQGNFWKFSSKLQALNWKWRADWCWLHFLKNQRIIY